MLSVIKNNPQLLLQLIDYQKFDFSLGKHFRQESIFFHTSTFNTLPLMVDLDGKISLSLTSTMSEEW